MNEVYRLEQLLETGMKFISESSESELTEKQNPDKWSKKEILGHLIDSGVNNLQRFTEIQFVEKPYVLKKYDQNQLVIANNYQNAETSEIKLFWLAINHRIKSLIKQQTETTLNYKVQLDNSKLSDLRFLIKDYVDHLEHHINQMME